MRFFCLFLSVSCFVSAYSSFQTLLSCISSVLTTLVFRHLVILVKYWNFWLQNPKIESSKQDFTNPWVLSWWLLPFFYMQSVKIIWFFFFKRKKEKDHAQQYLKIIFCKKAKKPYKHIGLRVPSFTSQLCSSAMYWRFRSGNKHTAWHLSFVLTPLEFLSL